MEIDYQKAAERVKALADPTRLKILDMLATEEMCVCEIIDRLHLSQPAVSHHLKTLRQADVISDRKEGKWVFYSLNRESYSELVQSLNLNIDKKKPQQYKHQPSIHCFLEND